MGGAGCGTYGGSLGVGTRVLPDHAKRGPALWGHEPCSRGAELGGFVFLVKYMSVVLSMSFSPGGACLLTRQSLPLSGTHGATSPRNG